MVIVGLTFFRYIYTDEVDITEENIESVMQLADKYLLTGLFDECTAWLQQNMTASNVCRLLPVAAQHFELAKIYVELNHVASEIRRPPAIGPLLLLP